jgi:aquaporin Z
MTQQVREALAEFAGTLILVFFAVGTAVFGIESIGRLGVAISFGFVLLALAYAIGPTSGCHINPAVTLGVLLRGGMSIERAGVYWVAQLLGGIAGAALLKLMVSDFGKVKDETGSLGTNNWGAGISGPGAFVAEVLMTFLLVFVVLLVTGRNVTPGFAGLAIGLTLTACHLVGLNLDGTGVNPARSLGPALFEGGDALSHVWLFLVAPLGGAVLAALAAPLVEAVQAPATPDPTGADVP